MLLFFGFQLDGVAFLFSISFLFPFMFLVSGTSRQGAMGLSDTAFPATAYVAAPSFSLARQRHKHSLRACDVKHDRCRRANAPRFHCDGCEPVVSPLAGGQRLVE